MDGDKIRVGKTENLTEVSARSKGICEDAFFDIPGECRKCSERYLQDFADGMDEENFRRLREGLALFDEVCDVMSKPFEQKLSRYFDTLVYFLEKAIEKYNARSGDALLFSRAVEELHQINCRKVKTDNSYLISENHPVLLMNKRLDLDTEKLLADKRQKAESGANSLSGTDYTILRSVFDAKKRNRRHMKLFSRNAVYETVPEEGGEHGCIRARLFQHSDAHTEIPVIRIWEKIENYLSTHSDKKFKEIKIATFGKLKDSPQYNGKQLLEKLTGTSISWTVFHREAAIGEYFFADESGEQLYDIMDSKDLRELVNNFQIILLLDENCFYRQRQAKKEVRESSEGVNCRWYYDRAEGMKDFKDKAVYYQMIYNRAGQWINSANEDMSATFEFDARLYRNLEAASQKDVDIYLYIKYGSKIGERNLTVSGVCNDEYYDGNSLIVCKLTGKAGTFNDDYCTFLKEHIDFNNKNLYVRIKFWKLLKSISNEYCDNILGQYSQTDKEQLAQVLSLFSKSYLVLKYEINSEQEKIEILYDFFIPENTPPDLHQAIKDITSVIINYAFSKEKMYCMNRYFEKLLVHSIISNANDIGDLVFAHWIATNWYNTESLKKGTINYQTDTSFSVKPNRFKVRKTAYAIIERLEDLRMRSGQDMKGYFLGTFIGEICPDVEPENIIETFRLITKCCEYFKHTGSSLYVNSKLIDS